MAKKENTSKVVSYHISRVEGAGKYVKFAEAKTQDSDICLVRLPGHKALQT